MEIVTKLTRRFDGTQTYECALCSTQFERERRNCPVCGSARIEQTS